MQHTKHPYICGSVSNKGSSAAGSWIWSLAVINSPVVPCSVKNRMMAYCNTTNAAWTWLDVLLNIQKMSSILGISSALDFYFMLAIFQSLTPFWLSTKTYNYNCFENDSNCLFQRCFPSVIKFICLHTVHIKNSLSSPGNNNHSLHRFTHSCISFRHNGQMF